MLSRLRQPLQHRSLARALFSTDTASASLSKGWTIVQQAGAGAASRSTETIHITPDGKQAIKNSHFNALIE